jgi:xanthine dehydrogenase YagS FAD-binding subunit
MMERTMLLETLYRGPGSAPHLETSIDHGDLIVAVSMPAPPEGRPPGLPQGARAGQL